MKKYLLIILLISNIGFCGLDLDIGEADNVAGPSSATDNNFAIFDGTTGKLIQDSGKSIDVLNYENAGVITLPTVTDNLDGTITIGTDGLYNFYANSTATNGIVQDTIAIGLTDQALADDSLSFIYADYNAGTPAFGITVSAVDFLTNADWVPLLRVYRNGNVLHITNYDAYGIALSSKSLYKDILLNSFQRQSGLTLSTSGTRISTISAGVAWFGVQSYILAENTSGTSGTLNEFYLTSGVWSFTEVTEYDSAYYSDGTDRLALDNNKYVAKYFYRAVESSNYAYYIHGNQYNNLADAIAEQVPVAPPEISSHAIYVGKIVIQKSETTGVAYPRAWEEALLASGATNHSDLANIYLAQSGVTYGHIDDQAQTIAGAKTFSDDIFANNLSGTNTGDQEGSIIATMVSTDDDAWVQIKEACTITKATMLADVSGSAVLDIWVDTYANYPPTVADTITASAKPTLSSAIKSTDSTLTDWTKTLSAGDIVWIHKDSMTTCEKVTLILEKD